MSAKSKQEWKSKARLAKKESVSTLYDDWERDELIEFIEELKTENEELKKGRKPEGKILSLSAKPGSEKEVATVQADFSGYKPEWTWVSKMVFVLRKVNKPLKSKELLKFLEGIDANVKFFADKTKTFSSLLNKAVKYHRVQEYRIRGLKGYYYILPEWMENEKLKPEFRQLINDYE